jgi:ketosteroid isomerase-like protein
MQTLHQLLSIVQEADDEAPKKSSTVEMSVFADNVEDFDTDNNAKGRKVKDHLWNTPGKLVWHGMPVFSHNSEYDFKELGPAFDAMEEAVKEVAGDLEHDDEIEVSGVGQFEDESFDIEWTSKIDPNELKHVWTAYNKKHDAFVLGYDAWAVDAEPDFNEAFDKEFKRVTGEDHNIGDEGDHDAVFDRAWKQYTDGKRGFYGVVFVIKMHNGQLTARNLTPFSPILGGFFRGSLPQMKHDAIWPDLYEFHA